MSDAAADIPRRLLRAEQVLAARTRRLALVLEGPQDPHNVHAVLRTAEALGIQDVHVVAPRRQAATVAGGITQGAHAWLSVRTHVDIETAAAVLRAEGRELWAAANVEKAVPLTGLVVSRPVAVLLGNETEGLSATARDLADRAFRIDLPGFSGSLNLSVAAAIVLWELRRLDVVSARPGDLADADLAAMRAGWYAALLGGEEAAAPWLARAEQVRAAAAASSRVLPADR